MAKKQVKDLELEEYVQLDGIEASDGLCISSGLSVIDGNYYQTTTDSLSNVYNFSGKNSFIQAEEAKSGSGESYGPACTGTKGFVIIGIKPEYKMLVLSSDTEWFKQYEDGYDPLHNILGNNVYSYSFAESAGTSCLVFTALDLPRTGAPLSVYVKDFPAALARYSSYTVEQCLQRYEEDDNGLYCPKHPEYGFVVLKNFFGNHVEGGSSRAIGKYTHAEGRCTTADIRYAHAEGSHTFAGGMGSHAEGFGWAGNENVALGSGSHAEGGRTKAMANCSHAEGSGTRALGDSSHAEGGPQSVELGTSKGNCAIGDSCHAEGGGDNYAGSRCFNVLGVYGLSAMIDNNPSRRPPDVVETPNVIKLDSVEGLDKIVVPDKLDSKGKIVVGTHPHFSIRMSSNYDFVGRIMSVDTVNKTISCDNLPSDSNAKFCGNRYDQLWIPGYPELGTYTLGYGAHAEGYSTTAQQNGAHSEGVDSVAHGKYSHAEGYQTMASYSSHASGYQTNAVGMYSCAQGARAVTGQPIYEIDPATGKRVVEYSPEYNMRFKNPRLKGHSYAYAWSGDGLYFSHGDGTFNINPKGGMNGLYVGNTCLGLGGQEFDLETGLGVLNALSALIEKFGGKVKPIAVENL